MQVIEQALVDAFVDFNVTYNRRSELSKKILKNADQMFVINALLLKSYLTVMAT